MSKNIKSLAILALAVTMITACSKSNQTPVVPQLQQDNSKQVLAYIQHLGFPASSIQENKNEYIVEEDILFPKNMKVPVDDGKPKTEQYYTGASTLLTLANSMNIRLKVDPSMNSMMAEINSAINQWNTVPATSIHWTIVTGTSYDVYIQNANLGSGICGQGTFPSGGAAGGLIRINIAQIAGNSFAQRQRTITHEMGHCISFRHTNWAAIGEPFAAAVPGVGGTDASSIMNGGQCGSGATVLSTKDKQATSALYP
ncbi:dual-action HEIGH metallo-peptidase [Chitinophaga niastensis]|uniref:Dual-action HEIGH metallo-peptidase n=1 Tax=Chitinophaga niastensis TaxID=536980 RepID=A0A2P8HHP3_CHINA|nr:M57 family metalloprotease [Chitinophaga niastensis]PSL45700.1 dual-action HEIGH metallo-peptidase [Chitinophaga niastensis]